MESLYAAIQNGADAIYLGGKMFSARQYANNFSDEELKKSCRICPYQECEGICYSEYSYR